MREITWAGERYCHTHKTWGWIRLGVWAGRWIMFDKPRNWTHKRENPWQGLNLPLSGLKWLPSHAQNAVSSRKAAFCGMPGKYCSSAKPATDNAALQMQALSSRPTKIKMRRSSRKGSVRAKSCCSGSASSQRSALLVKVKGKVASHAAKAAAGSQARHAGGAAKLPSVSERKREKVPGIMLSAWKATLRRAAARKSMLF